MRPAQILAERGYARSRAVILAATAEACVFALPAYLVTGSSGAFVIGPLLFAILFVGTFSLATVLTYRFRASDPAPVLALTAIGTGLVLGAGQLEHTLMWVIVAILVALRVATLALRDWSVPVEAPTFVAGAVLGLECLAASGAQRAWATPLVVLVPAFFAAALASRAAIVWSPEHTAETRDETERWTRSTARLSLALAAVALAAVVLASVIDRLGSVLAPIARGVVAVVVAAVSQVLRPVFWGFERLRLNPEGARRILEQLRENVEEAHRAAARHASPASAAGPPRVLALLLLAGLVLLAVKVFRRLRKTDRPVLVDGDPEGAIVTTPKSDDGQGEAFPVRRVRSEPPADTVRRWYAEVLAELRTSGLEKSPESTPAEFERTVAGSLPDTASDLAPLTRAYEDVRYGGVSFAPEALSALDRHRRALLAMVRRTPRPDDS